MTNKPSAAPNYPDILGALSGGTRHSFDALQVAVSPRPVRVEGGKPFSIIVLLQNCLNVDIDAVIVPEFPEVDTAGKKNIITTKLMKPLRIGLRPGEVGYAELPLQVTHQATPGEGYQVGADITVEVKGRNPTRVRDANGGIPVVWDDFPPERQPILEPIQGLGYAATPRGRMTGRSGVVTAPLMILPAAIAGLPPDRKPNYVSLWTSADYVDVTALIQAGKPAIEGILKKLTRTVAFFALLKQTQTLFTAARYRLWAGEAVMIAKLMVQVLESGEALPIGASTVKPRWYAALEDMAKKQTASLKPGSAEPLLIGRLYKHLLYDAAMFGFSALEAVTREDFGTPEEMAEFTENLIHSLEGGNLPLDFSRAYLPLVLGGIIANNVVVMPSERANETVNLLHYALQQRADERDDYTDFIFAMANDLLDRALMS
ncbi:MAG TPA: hypothetical protein PLD47_02010 [Aggregatilineales bacterium]|nr:hypothetical protein [Anaerolineales bacterium]HRE46474.1 hypothetical protein [Aggregatilineales bacterium]